MALRAYLSPMSKRPFPLFSVALLALLAVPATAADDSAVDKRVPVSRSEIQLSFAPLVKQVAPAVVNVYSKRVERTTARRSPLFDDPFFKRFFGDGDGMGPPRERVEQSLGSGVIVEADGIIVTNNHVIDGATEITVALGDRREFEAKVVAADSRVDLAVLRIDTKGEALPHLALRDSDDLEVGDVVLAIGDPFGVGQTVTQGIISALGRTVVGNSDTQSYIQTDAAINPGNSGGALITMDGRLAGINTAIYSQSGGSLGIGFAIPSNLVANTVAQAIAGKGIVRPWLGAGGQSVTSDIASGLGLKRPGGVLVGNIYPGGPAELGGLKTGDVITRIDGRDVDDPRGLKFRVATKKLGEPAVVEVIRNGAPLKMQIRMEPAPEKPAREITPLGGSQPLAGATVGNLSPAFADELGVDPLMSGVIITEVAPGSTAQRLRMRAGDLVEKVNGAPVRSVAELQRLLRVTGGWEIVIKRGDQRFNLVIRG